MFPRAFCSPKSRIDKNGGNGCLLVLNHGFISTTEFSTYCSHQALGEDIADQSIVYIRTECRLCQCSMGELICDPMPEYCDQLLAKSCVMSKGYLEDGARHFDGCNNCVCRNGKRCKGR